MMILFRILFTGLFLFVLYRVTLDSGQPAVAGDIGPALHLGAILLTGIVAAAFWAPVLGDWVSHPLTEPLVQSKHLEERNRTLRWIRHLENRGYRRLTVACCFLEGLNRPWLPTAFVIGMHQTRRGSRLNHLFAREVFRFDNARNCLEAYEILDEAGEPPELHGRAEVAKLIAARERGPAPDRAPMEVPKAPDPSAVQRNRRIRLFDRKSNSDLADGGEAAAPKT